MGLETGSCDVTRLIWSDRNDYLPDNKAPTLTRATLRSSVADLTRAAPRFIRRSRVPRMTSMLALQLQRTDIGSSARRARIPLPSLIPRQHEGIASSADRRTRRRERVCLRRAAVVRKRK